MFEQQIKQAFHLKVPLSGIYALLNDPSIRWGDDGFDPRKAYVCACLSELAYLHLAENEVPGSDRYKFFPGMAFELLFTRQIRFDVAEVFGAVADLRITIIEREFFVYAVVETGHFAIVAVRGTRVNKWQDWAIDFNALKNHARHGFYHRGFHDEACAAMPLIEKVVEDRRPLYFTGHSLGGAVASILSRIWRTPPAPLTPYVFGSARFATRAGAARQPRYAFVRPLDLVPHLPCRWMGYSDEGASIHLLPPDAKTGSGADAVSHIFYHRDFEPHAIESYRKLTGDLTGQSASERAYVDALIAAFP